MVSDLFAWLDELKASKVHLVGHDWGASIAYIAAATLPDRFCSLTTLSVPHVGRINRAIKHVPKQVFKSWYMIFFQMYGLAEITVRYKQWTFIKWLWKRWSPSYSLESEEWEKLINTLEQRGVLKAMLNYYRQNLSLLTSLGLKKDALNSLKTVPVPTLALTGEQDGCIDSKLYDFCFYERDFSRGYHVERISDAGHFLHLERPEIVNPLLLDWFAKCEQLS